MRNLFLGQPVTGKFYDKRHDEGENQEQVKKYVERLIVQGPRETFDTPITENQRKVSGSEIVE